ncbi:MAG: hypothetical protein KIS92_10400 [Planctomycetota bacterium]|nr:hypothetical protein [Planctomycetota bacterium]
MGLGAGLALVLAWVTTTGCTQGPAAIERPTRALSTSGWNLRLADAPAHPQSATFNGLYRPGEPLLIPAGTAFFLEPNGGVLPLSITPESAWIAQGGGLDLAANAAQVLAGRAPRVPGSYRIDWKDPHFAPRQGSVRVLVLEAAEAKTTNDRRTRLSAGGKSLGWYLDPAQAPVARIKENAARYVPPAYFTTLTDETAGLPLGEDLDLGQIVAFMDHRDANGRKVFTTQRHTQALPPNRELFNKLNLLRERLRRKGVKVTRFWITSGFRTPDYNKQIGGAAYSRHCFGDAVDLCIDEDGDRHMDDLNGDGKIDRNDGIVIGRACAELEAEGLVVPGGIGVYEWDGEDSVRSHVHVDCRGYAVRWGQAARGRGKTAFDWWSAETPRDVEAGEASE